MLKHEKDDNSELHKAVARKLLQDGAFLPQWLLISYKVSNEKVFFGFSLFPLFRKKYNIHINVAETQRFGASSSHVKYRPISGSQRVSCRLY